MQLPVPVPELEELPQLIVIAPKKARHTPDSNKTILRDIQFFPLSGPLWNRTRQCRMSILDRAIFNRELRHKHADGGRIVE